MLTFVVSLVLASPAVPPPYRLRDWSQPLVVDQPGTRVAMIVEARDELPVHVEVGGGQQWVVATPTWQRGRVSVLVADLTVATRSTFFRSVDAERILLVDADLFMPGEPEARRRLPAPPPTPGVLPTELTAIGVVSRADWDADPTTCSSTEDDWYRMAIHHTAGSQTYGGTVQGAVQALQAYSLGSGEYCDIPYQFLVGYDGSLWEGRPYDYYSGATGGGNNDGNVAVSFLGCYHPSDCSTSNPVTEEMMDGGQLLVQTMVALENIPSDDDAIRGHRDWPDNATACPGDWLYDRLDELREPLGPTYAASLAGQSCSPVVEGAFEVVEGELGACTLEFLNIGSATWTPGLTHLAPIPRDDDSVLAAESWLNGHRIATVGSATAPGATGQFSFDVYGASVGEHVLALGLLHEGVAWFADDGGPADGSVTVALTVSAAAQVADTGPHGTGVAGATLGPGEPSLIGDVAGCGCTTAGGGSVAWMTLLAPVVALGRGQRAQFSVSG